MAVTTVDERVTRRRTTRVTAVVGLVVAALVGLTPTTATAATVPGAPGGFVWNTGSKRISLAWDRAAEGGSPILESFVIPFINGVEQPTRSAGNANGIIMVDLRNDTTYTFKVASRNSIGLGPRSAMSPPITPTRPVSAYTPFDSYNAMVVQQYVDLAGARPTKSSESAWVSDIAAGRKTYGDLAAALRKTADNTGSVDPTVRIYRAFLGRSPDADGLQFWIKRKRNKKPARTWTVTQIATEFTKGSEFVAKYGSKTNREFVTRIYTDVLGRPADPSGVDYWTGKLDSGTRTRATVMVGFSESSEYKTKQLQNTDVTVAYVYLLDRAPTASEIDGWVTRQKAGTTVATLSAEILGSHEYRDRFGWYD